MLSLTEGTQISIILDDEDTNTNGIEDELNPDETFELYHKWQAYAAKQGQKHLVEISRLGKVPEPNKKVLEMIVEMKHSNDLLVLNIVLGSLEILLREFKAYPLVIKMAENNVSAIMRTSACFDAVITAIGLLKYFSTYVDKNRCFRCLQLYSPFDFSLSHSLYLLLSSLFLFTPHPPPAPSSLSEATRGTWKRL